jgi:hypothetical protein
MDFIYHNFRQRLIAKDWTNLDLDIFMHQYNDIIIFVVRANDGELLIVCAIFSDDYRKLACNLKSVLFLEF